MGFCGNGYYPFSKWMILFRGLNCPSSISFVEVSERGIVKVISGACYTHVALCKNEWKSLEEQFEPTGELLLSNKPWAYFSQFKTKGSTIDSCCEKKRWLQYAEQVVLYGLLGSV